MKVILFLNALAEASDQSMKVILSRILDNKKGILLILSKFVFITIQIMKETISLDVFLMSECILSKLKEEI